MRKTDYLRLLLMIAGMTVVSTFLNGFGIAKETILMVFMVGVLLVSAVTRGYRFGIIASLASVILFNYFYTEPLHTLAINSSSDMLLMAFFLIAAVISSGLTARFQRQLLISRRNENTAKLLYEVSQSFLNVTGESNIIMQGIHYIKDHTGCDCAVELVGKEQTYTSSESKNGMDKGKKIPIMGIARNLGRMIVYDHDLKPNLEQQWLIQSVAVQLGIALDREFVYNERENIRIAMEREHVKSNLLRSIGHDLRTPLTGIAGSSSYIIQRCESLDRENIKRIASEINEQAVWLTTLVENILNMTRIDNGKLTVNRQTEVIDDVVNEAVTHVIGLSERPFKISLPKEVIAISMDGRMIVQVLVNLLDNAVKHTPPESRIDLTIEKKEDFIEFDVSDSGFGIDEALNGDLFEAFVTNGKPGSDGKRGIGLGLAICKAVVEAHGGTIRTGKSRFGGASFLFDLPCTEDEEWKRA